MSGLTADGFEIKTLAAIRSSIEQRQLSSPAIGANQDVSDFSALGQLNASFSSEAAELWELAAAVYFSADPEAAVGVAMTMLASLTGTERRGATATVVKGIVMNLEPGTLVPAGSLVSVESRPDLQFELDVDVENTGGAAADILIDVDGNPIVFRCTQTGPISVNPDTLNVIDTAVSGWNTVNNAGTSGIPGRVADTDLTLRERRAAQLALRGGSTVRAIRADLLDTEATPELDTIEAVIVLENASDANPDINGLPPHSFEVILDDGPTPSVDDDVIAQVIYDAKPAGIKAFGTSDGTALDEYLLPHLVAFSRVTRLPVYIDLQLTTGQGFPLNGLEQVKQAIVDAGRTLNVGADVVALFLRSACFSVPGVIDVPIFELGFSPSPAGTTNLPVGVRERATFAVENLVYV